MPRSVLVNVTVAAVILLPCGSLMIPETEAVEATVCPESGDRQKVSSDAARARSSVRLFAFEDSIGKDTIQPPKNDLIGEPMGRQN